LVSRSSPGKFECIFDLMNCRFIPVFGFLLSILITACAQPVIINGEMVSSLRGKPISTLRVRDLSGKPVLFQVDEVTADGEYVLTEGEEPNTESGNGLLDKQDEIVFLWEDCSAAESLDSSVNDGVLIRVEKKSESRYVIIDASKDADLSGKSYLHYDHSLQMLRTPYYYAQFGKDRFHFTRAGIRDLRGSGYIDLTAELKIEIVLKALWGLIPIRYTEENIVCIVKRYKTGPLRLIRRGDFHLNLGLGIKGSRAAVNQICYPRLVNVPVYIHVPIRFRSLFGDAHFEMSPVIKEKKGGFAFKIPQASFSQPVSGPDIDTIIDIIPNHRFMGVTDGLNGYGWLLKASIPDSLLSGSAFVFRRPSSRSQVADCGYRIKLRDLHKGYYDITNWVMFPEGSFDRVINDFQSILKPLHIYTSDGRFSNLLSAPAKKLKRK
jgi:hypothetical protein